jgi:hypothetical protein
LLTSWLLQGVLVVVGVAAAAVLVDTELAPVHQEVVLVQKPHYL